jgi:5-methyltetrahydrofolate--homocysteine methyltransferase
LGIKQPIQHILDVAHEHNPDVIGMSGLLVKSTVIMKENLEEMNARGIAERYPVLLGGAALTRSYVENDLSSVFQGDVRYARDAFEGLRLMDGVMARKKGLDPQAAAADAAKVAERKARHERSLRIAEKRRAASALEEAALVLPARSDVATDNPVPTPPFWGSRVVKGIALAEYSTMLDERATFMGQWGLRGVRGGKGPSYEELVEKEGRPRLRYWLERLHTEQVLEAAVVYGYFPCVSEGDDVVVLAGPKPDADEVHRFTFPRQRRDRHLCLADFYRSREAAQQSGQVDVIAFTVVTMGQRIADFANELFAANAYRDYLEVHGLSVQLTEALAEFWHQRIRSELVFADGSSAAADDAADVEKFFDLEYRGARYSFGYPACPDLTDQTKVMTLLEPQRIGVELSEEFQLHPEQSTSALVAHHPEAKYFAAR